MPVHARVRGVQHQQALQRMRLRQRQPGALISFSNPVPAEQLVGTLEFAPENASGYDESLPSLTHGGHDFAH